ncbi:MAG: PorT family protein [Balneolaceae bacterium]|nr:MAG: PorT family protein [Balneolaceae bacterium]
MIPIHTINLSHYYTFLITRKEAFLFIDLVANYYTSHKRVFTMSILENQLSKMKSIRFLLSLAAIILLLLPVLSSTTHAQRLGLGVTAGVNTSTHLENFRFVSGDINLDFSPGISTGFNAGLMVRQGITQRFRFQAEPSIAMLGASYDDSFTLRGFDFETDSKTQLLYVQLPLLIQFTTVPPERTVFGRQRSETTYHLTGGVFGGYLLDAQFSGSNSGAPIGIEFQGAFSEDVRNQYKEYDGGVVLGGGLEHGHNSKIGLEARIMFSVIDSGDADFSFRPQNIGVSFSLYYML